ncbi:hypothetical protein [Jeotgalibacillus terrae]|uniref:Uncharacterized protein n=1 Tax=Jeotgalibacillus terrae TaxID=587735 RepID=A0ABW5ZKC4_9BACL|nr:hypothetical protein [Jeotgalibacillus terrae]MBM7578137.1 hypothetical protein [Jeotgalibacillus terrae]
MKKALKKSLIIMFSAVTLFLVVSALTNPTPDDYIKFDEAETGIQIPDNVRIATADFIFFSIYAPSPKDAADKYGAVHLGFMGHFFKMSDGQYDESFWKRFLK